MRWLIGSLLGMMICGLTSVSSVSAVSASQILITEVHLGGDAITVGGVDYKQYVTLYNQSDHDISLQGWRLQYAKSDFKGTCTGTTWSTESALSGTIAKGASKLFTYQLTDEAAGAVRIIDSSLTVHDLVGWGSASPCFETKQVGATPSNNKSLIRYADCDGSFNGIDSNNNSRDFASNQQPFTKVLLPECTPDCRDDQMLQNNVCIDDQCPNLPNFQTDVPADYYKKGALCYVLHPILLKITEVLPNVTGLDTGKEFIELYNPNDSSVDLANYILYVGEDTTHPYSFTADTKIESHAYMSVSDSGIGFTLSNTKSKVTLKSTDDQLIDETADYENPATDMSWSLIDDVWQYTNRPTPGEMNMTSLVEDVSVATEKPCESNQYRSVETGRCRLIVTATEPAPCKDNQYRSEETGRCRTLAAAAIASQRSCAVDQIRNPDTGRCRKIAVAASEPAPCKQGQERNPDTNRCRNVTSKMPESAFAVQPIADTGKAFTGWWVLGGVGSLALGRIGWEWRTEMLAGIRKVGTFFTSGK